MGKRNPEGGGAPPPFPKRAMGPLESAVGAPKRGSNRPASSRAIRPSPTRGTAWTYTATKHRPGTFHNQTANIKSSNATLNTKVEVTTQIHPPLSS